MINYGLTLVHPNRQKISYCKNIISIVPFIHTLHCNRFAEYFRWSRSFNDYQLFSSPNKKKLVNTQHLILWILKMIFVSYLACAKYCVERFTTFFSITFYNLIFHFVIIIDLNALLNQDISKNSYFTIKYFCPFLLNVCQLHSFLQINFYFVFIIWMSYSILLLDRNFIQAGPNLQHIVSNDQVALPNLSYFFQNLHKLNQTSNDKVTLHHIYHAHPFIQYKFSMLLHTFGLLWRLKIHNNQTLSSRKD